MGREPTACVVTGRERFGVNAVERQRHRGGHDALPVLVPNLDRDGTGHGALVGCSLVSGLT
jgi:hypothetical protein